MKLYCPACGETSDIVEEIILTPDYIINVECPICTVKFDIKIEFYLVEVEDEPQ